MKRYYWTEDGHVGRLDKTDTEYLNAEILRDGKWVPILPRDLLWNANPISKEQAIEKLTKWTNNLLTEGEAKLLLSKET